MGIHCLSVITNFGCHFQCSYCITKKAELQIPKSTTEGLNNLPQAIEDYDPEIISISGSGDPMFEYDQHYDWWSKFHAFTADMNLALHTSYAKLPQNFITDRYKMMKEGYEPYIRIVYHLHSYLAINHLTRYMDEKVRVVFVVDPTFTEEKIDTIANMVANSNIVDELSFRQMVDKNYNKTYFCYPYLKEGHEAGAWNYIEQGDYNTYYCENKIYKEFRKIGES